jgi:hypothetical protein
MPQAVCMGAQLQCTFGAAPGNLVVTPENTTNANNMPAATIMDNIPMKNIMPFGVCSSMSNPQVAAATSAAQGVLTPQPCIPVTSAPWILTGQPKVMIKNKPALLNTGKLMCNWGGQISIVNAGQTKVNV